MDRTEAIGVLFIMIVLAFTGWGLYTVVNEITPLLNIVPPEIH